MVATSIGAYARREYRLSVPFSSGQWLLLRGSYGWVKTGIILSVPFSSGQWLLQENVGAHAVLNDLTFSPLFIGAMVATLLAGLC